MRIFVTGGTGFIGTHLVKKLREDKNNELFLLSKDLTDIENWKKEVEDFRPEACIHLAWEGLPDYGCKMSIKNLKYGLDLMNLLARIGCKRIVSTGSCWEILPQPNNAFSAAKNAFHRLGREIAKENNMHFIWTRLFYVYGPGQRETSLIPYLINCAKQGKSPEIKNPDAKNDFVYVEDVAEALTMIVKKCQKSAIYNIGSGKLTKVGDIAKMIFPDQSLALNNNCLKPGFKQLCADIAKIKKEIGWEPKTIIRDGIKKTISYYSSIK